jgi:hypothetical protein
MNGSFLKENIFPKKPQTIMELRGLIIQACNEMRICAVEYSTSAQFVMKKLPDVMVVILNS